ncbi:hypothetical protein WOLCODRAFT_156229 [Wolfiporia cocos MD-104 SS10]|uniref:Uncharacterized protein n=1 Tax=Wolfiporia cocos (strain MD-104) TaxID=742152 RepID=A0A2H3J1G3_WOLCO|nr:hypothetical protein WOLCODRAFT_156229 [Wolfiporia cocos MD-104 SS10]
METFDLYLVLGFIACTLALYLTQLKAYRSSKASLQVPRTSHSSQTNWSLFINSRVGTAVSRIFSLPLGPQHAIALNTANPAAVLVLERRGRYVSGPSELADGRTTRPSGQSDARCGQAGARVAGAPYCENLTTKKLSATGVASSDDP